MKTYEKLAQLVEWYERVTPEYELQCVREIAQLTEDLLPHGSGFDDGCHIAESSKPDRIVIHTSFHHMTENGYYDGWTHHNVIVTPSMTSGFDIRVTGRNTSNDIKSYIAEMFDDALSSYYDGSQDTESRLHTLADVVKRFLCKSATFADLKLASQDIL